MAILLPRDSDLIIKELSEVNFLLTEHHAMAEKHPSDPLLALSLRQFEHRKKQLLKELHLSLSLYFTERAA